MSFSVLIAAHAVLGSTAGPAHCFRICDTSVRAPSCLQAAMFQAASLASCLPPFNTAPDLPVDLHCLQAGYPVTLLSEQHRMHPAIAVWPSTFFYQGQLVTARSLADGKARRADFHSQPCFPPLAFFDCRRAGADLPFCLEFTVDPVSCLRHAKHTMHLVHAINSYPAQQVLKAKQKCITALQTGAELAVFWSWPFK